MKTITLEKKNRKYFAAKLESGNHCKVVINEHSEALSLGQPYTLDFKDRSRRTKYGTEMIFELETEHRSVGIVTLKAPYNANLVQRCKQLGGSWDRSEELWVFSALIAQEVEDLEAEYSMDMTGIEIKAKSIQEEYLGTLHVAGVPICTAFGRDSGAKLSSGMSMIEGEIYSGGSMKNWYTRIAEGSVFRFEIPKAIINDIDPDEWEIKLL